MRATDTRSWPPCSLYKKPSREQRENGRRQKKASATAVLQRARGESTVQSITLPSAARGVSDSSGAAVRERERGRKGGSEEGREMEGASM